MKKFLKKFFKVIIDLIFYGMFFLGCFTFGVLIILSARYEEAHHVYVGTEIEETRIKNNVYPHRIRSDELGKIAEKDTQAIQIMFDQEYNFTDLEEWKVLLEKVAEKQPYQKEIFDCENFSLSVITNLAKEGINGAGLVGGNDFSKSSSTSSAHVWIAFIAKTEQGLEIYYYEPQQNKILGRASEIKDYQAEFIQWY